MLSPGSAFLLAYLPARRVALEARRGLVERHAATSDAALAHAVAFSRQALKVEDSSAQEADARFATVAANARVDLPAPPASSEHAGWLEALPGRIEARLSAPVLHAAWRAGETARRIAIAAELAAHVAYLRCAAPGDPALRARATELAAELDSSAATFTRDLQATGLPLVIGNADNVRQLVGLTGDLAPTTTAGYRALNELARDLRGFFDSTAHHLDAPAPAPASSPPTAEEDRLVAQILAAPHDAGLRVQLATLAGRRGDPRAALIRAQYAGDVEAASALIRSHPEWSRALEQLGARDIRFSGGFPDEVTVDAGLLLARGRDLLAAAPLTRLHVRAARGRVGELVRSPLLATLEALDLDDQGVTDDDVVALAASPHAARLRQLDLRYNPITARGIEAIAASPHLRLLEVVSLDGNPADPVDQLAYHDETHTHVEPTAAGQALEARFGPLRWLHPHGAGRA